MKAPPAEYRRQVAESREIKRQADLQAYREGAALLLSFWGFIALMILSIEFVR